MASTWSTGAYAPQTSPLTAEEKAPFPPHQDVTADSLPAPIGVAAGGCMRSEASRMRTAREVLSHYNAEHPGTEFDAVKPLMEDTVYFRGKAWFHINFWARSHSNKNIKLFFAELHYEPLNDGLFTLIPVVTACRIINEPFSQYRSSCAFCRTHLEILHPADDHDFVCGSGKDEDWMIKEWFGMRLIRRQDLPFPNNKACGCIAAYFSNGAHCCRCL